MKRIDIIGVPGSGKSTFIKNLNFPNLVFENLLVKQVVYNNYTYLKLLQVLPLKIKTKLVNTLYKDLVDKSLYSLNNNDLIYKYLLEDQSLALNNQFLQTKRIEWFNQRYFEMNFLKNYFKDQNLIVLFDESVLQKIISLYVNIAYSESNFENLLNNIEKPNGILVFKNDLNVSTQRVINRRKKQKSSRPHSTNVFNLLLDEAKKYDDLINVVMDVYKDVKTLVIDLEASNDENETIIKKFISTF